MTRPGAVNPFTATCPAAVNALMHSTKTAVVIVAVDVVAQCHVCGFYKVIYALLHLVLLCLQVSQLYVSSLLGCMQSMQQWNVPTLG